MERASQPVAVRFPGVRHQPSLADCIVDGSKQIACSLVRYLYNREQIDCANIFSVGQTLHRLIS